MRFDIVVIGGGINGAGIARDAAGRGMSVLLLEQGDLAGATSSASSKLIHGGLRYLEHYKFSLVREALAEREVLWRMAPHLVRPLSFVLPHRAGMRPKWMLRAGLFLYDILAPRRLLPAARSLDLERAPEGADLKPQFRRGFRYSDCAVDDSRLTILNARDAADRGADIRTRAQVVALERKSDHWVVRFRGADGLTHDVEAAAIVNAAGPWAGAVTSMALGTRRSAIRLVRGSHLIVRRTLAHGSAYTFQNDDGRVVFAIPYGKDLTLLGTTDVDHDGDPARPQASHDERDYILAAVNRYFRDAIVPDDVVSAYAGVRALYDDGASAAKDATRDYVLSLDTAAAPILSVYGGKITTYRRLAEAALARLATVLPKAGGANWTGNVPLPGGDFPTSERADLIAGLESRYPFLPAGVIERLASAYGTRAGGVLGEATSESELGRHFGGGFYEAELRYLMAEEWAVTADDVVWRRSRLGLVLSSAEVEAIAAFMAAQSSEQRVAAE